MAAWGVLLSSCTTHLPLLLASGFSALCLASRGTRGPSSMRGAGLAWLLKQPLPLVGLLALATAS